jgi:hypothetical protein
MAILSLWLQGNSRGSLWSYTNEGSGLEGAPARSEAHLSRLAQEISQRAAIDKLLNQKELVLLLRDPHEQHNVGVSQGTI